jgi:hypothetical protein
MARSVSSAGFMVAATAGAITQTRDSKSITQAPARATKSNLLCSTLCITVAQQVLYLAGFFFVNQ